MTYVMKLKMNEGCWQSRTFLSFPFIKRRILLWWCG